MQAAALRHAGILSSSPIYQFQLNVTCRKPNPSVPKYSFKSLSGCSKSLQIGICLTSKNEDVHKAVSTADSTAQATSQ